MLNDHTLDAYHVFSYLLETQTLGSADVSIKKLLRIANDFQPTIIFWQHIGKFPITTDLLTELRNLSSQPLLVYHEGDAYGKYRKRLTPSMKLLAKFSDLLFTIGLGELAGYFRDAGARNVIYAPHCVDTVRFGVKWNPNEGDRSGVVMIGNLLDDNPVFRNIPFLRFPGTVERVQFAQRLYKRIGKRFKVYGRGWEKYPFSAGSVAYADQEKVLRQNLLSVNWDHFPNIPYYFSDRLPISMISGVAHATNYHPGYELLFKNGEQLVYYHSVQAAVDDIDWLLSQPANRLIEIGIEGERFIRKNLTASIVYRRMVQIIKEKLFGESFQ